MRRHVLQGGLLAVMVMISGVAGIPHASAQVEPSPFFINPGLNDAWWFGTKGQGFLFTVLPQTKAVFLAWFTFDTERPPQDVSAILGDPGHRWFTALGFYEELTNSITLDIELTEGMIFDSPVPEKTQTPGYGTMTLTFSDCSNATMSYEFPEQDLSGEYVLVRTAEDPENVALCESLNAELQPDG